MSPWTINYSAMYRYFRTSDDQTQLVPFVFFLFFVVFFGSVTFVCCNHCIFNAARTVGILKTKSNGCCGCEGHSHNFPIKRSELGNYGTFLEPDADGNFHISPTFLIFKKTLAISKRFIGKLQLFLLYSRTFRFTFTSP